MTTPLETAAAVTIHVDGLDDLLNIIPSLLGFHPKDSIVTVLLDKGRVKATIRMDLDAASSVQAVKESLSVMWDRFPTADLVAVAYAEEGERAWTGLVRVVRAWGGRSRCATFHVDSQRWYVDSDDPGMPYRPASSAVAAEATFHGMRVLADRAELEGALEPLWSAEQMGVAVLQAIRIAPCDAVPAALSLAVEWMRLPQGRPLTLEEAVSLAVAAHNDTFVEAVVSGMGRNEAERAVELWTNVVRGASPGLGAAAAVILGIAAWLRGDGALVNICLARATPYQRDWHWLRFLDLTQSSALPPDEWDGVRAELLSGCGLA